MFQSLPSLLPIFIRFGRDLLPENDDFLLWRSPLGRGGWIPILGSKNANDKKCF